MILKLWHNLVYAYCKFEHRIKWTDQLNKRSGIAKGY